jgi:SOS-response transcriptional repressor LexA
MAMDTHCLLANKEKMKRQSSSPIRDKRRELDLTLEKLSEITGISPSHLSRIESGKRGKGASHAIVEALSQALNMTPDEMGLAGSGDIIVSAVDGGITVLQAKQYFYEKNKRAQEAGETMAVPVISFVSAGNLRDQPGVTKADIERWIQVADLPAGNWVALTVQGDSMDRIAPEGSTILVNRADDRLVDGRFYVFSLRSGPATFKRYRRLPAEMLQPFSTNFDHMAIPVADEDLYVFGRVRRVITDC